MTHPFPRVLGLSVVDLRLLPSVLTPVLLWQEELEHLNQASEEINQVELQLDVSLSLLTALGCSLESSLGRCDGLYMLGSGSGSVGRCGLVGVGVGLGFNTLVLAAWNSLIPLS